MDSATLDAHLRRALEAIEAARTELDSGDPPWMHTARGEIGVREMPGREAHPRIVEYHSATQLATRPAGESDETPWCSSLVCWVMERHGGSPRSAWARSWATWGVECGLRTGAIVVLTRGTRSGHVGFLERAEGDKLWLLGGNQANSVCVRAYPTSRLLAVRWPT